MHGNKIESTVKSFQLQFVKIKVVVLSIYLIMIQLKNVQIVKLHY